MKESFVKRILDSKHAEAIAVILFMTVVGIILAVLLLPKGQTTDSVCNSTYIAKYVSEQCNDLESQKTYDFNNR